MLNSLQILNFRSLKNFGVSRLGNVNLIVGKNNSGKSTVLEALRIYAGNANRNLLETIAEEHDERYQIDVGRISSPIVDDDEMPFEAFFSGRKFPTDQADIVIGQGPDDSKALRIRHGYIHEFEVVDGDVDEFERRIVRREVPLKEARLLSEEVVNPALFISKGEKSYRLRLDLVGARVRSTVDFGLDAPCSFLPARNLSPEELADQWDKVVLTSGQAQVLDALRIINPDFEDLAFVGEDRFEERPGRRNRGAGPRVAKVRLKGASVPVPLNSMGDGMSRVLRLVLKSHAAKGGFLLIDEFENGLHYSVQEEVWHLIFELACSLRIQVFATTHSWDCVSAFSRVATARADMNGVLFRMGVSARKDSRGQVIATVFDENELVNICQADLDIR